MDLEEDGRAGWGCPGGVQVSGVGAVAVVRPLTWWPFGISRSHVILTVFCSRYFLCLQYFISLRQ